MKDDDTIPCGLKLSLIKLGRVAGKIKYTLVDDRDLDLTNLFYLDARLDIDRNGNGASIHAFAYKRGSERDTAIHLHKLIWLKHHGYIPQGYFVAHHNDITMDNRLDNLYLLTAEDYIRKIINRYNDSLSIKRSSSSSNNATSETSASSHSNRADNQLATTSNIATPNICNAARSTINNITTTNQHDNLYYEALKKLDLRRIIEEDSNCLNRANRSYDANGDFVLSTSATSIFECRHLLCSRVEAEPGQFSICGRCQEARYCGKPCQLSDWPVHLKLCREKEQPRSQPSSSHDDDDADFSSDNK